MRIAEAHETEAIWAGLEAWGRGVAEHVIDDREIWLDGETVRIVGPAVVPDEIVEGAVGGLVIGQLSEVGFLLGLQGAVLVAPHTKRGVVKVLEKGGRSWLYGKSILGESILSADRYMNVGDACIVANERGEALGVGMIVGNLKGKGEVIQPLHELGTYLRDQ